MIKKDLFGFVTQGLNYELFRPKYPGALLGECLRGLKMKNNYLDVATGTGQVLFKLCGEFKGTLIGTDISENMLKAAQTKAYEFQRQSGIKVQLQKKDCMGMFPAGLKFDLITVGQALHWFDVPKFLNHSKSLLNPLGKLACIGYIMTGIQPIPGSVEAIEGKLPQSALQLPNVYKEFYSKVKPHFDFDRDELQRSYTDQKYNFKDHFAEVVRIDDTVTTNISTKNLVGYLKTYSGYNCYVDKTGQDPIADVEKGLSDFAEVAMTIKYFGVYCRHP